MTRPLLMSGLFAPIARYTRSGPIKSSASNQPPTVSTAQRMFFRCRQDGTGLPILIVGGMRDGLVPHRVRTSESGRDVAQRSELEEELVAVTRAVVERYRHLGWGPRLWRKPADPSKFAASMNAPPW